VSYTEFERYDTKHFDTALGAHAAFDVLKTESFSLYGKGGLSVHQFGTESFKPATLVNADLGAGAAVAVAQNVSLGAEYQYSTTLLKDDMKAKDWDFRVKDLAQTRNDYSLFVAFKF
jgi:opacity protein-like surface antigen